MKGKYKMNYSEILSRAWQIIWKHKVLWIFGILAGCASSGGGGGGGGGNTNFSRDGQAPSQLQPYLNQAKAYFDSVPLQTWILIAIGIALLVLILVVLAIFLGTIGRIALIRGAQQADQDLEARLTFGELFKGSRPYFWRVFLLNLLVGLVFFVVGILLAVGAILGVVVTLGIGILCLIPLLCLLVPVAIVISVVIEQATIAIVVENLGVLDGLRRGWEVVKTNAGPMVVMWLILDLGIRGIAGIIIALPMLLVFAPLLIGVFANAQQALQTGLVVSLVCCAAYLPVLIILSGILQSYVSSAWTLTFLRLTKPAQSSPEPLPEILPEPQN
jgi:hypothetical protein